MDKKFHYTGLMEEAANCAHCGYCRDVCPIYQVGEWESFSPRGKIALTGAMKNNDYPDKLVERVYQCTLCGACREACHVDIDTQAMWLELREKIAAANKAPEAMCIMRQMVLNTGNIAGEDPNNRLLWTENLDEVPEGIAGKKKPEVLYLLGCLSSLFPAAFAVSQSMAKVLAKANINFTTLGPEEICCGFPLMAAGFSNDMAEIAKKNVAKIEALAPAYIVTTCPSCLHTWTHQYPKILGRKISIPVLHSSQYLLKLVEDNRFTFNQLDQVVTYHDPCDLGRNNGIFDEPRKLINAVPGVQLVEMEANRNDALCCGGGGNLEMADKDMAACIGDVKAHMISETGAKTVITGCQQCKRTLTASVRRAKMRVKVMELAEFLLSALEG